VSTLVRLSLVPWISNRKSIYELSQNDCTTARTRKYINKPVEEAIGNSKILKDFCIESLLFLQKEIQMCWYTKQAHQITYEAPSKTNTILLKPVFQELNRMHIYWNKLILRRKILPDHFAPHAFVSHDLIWNLIPIDQL
jgi:hypothetical protein